MIKKILKRASAMGACAKSETASDWKSLAWLLFSPQGREFCTGKQFPDPGLWGEIKRHCPDSEGLNVFIDANFVTLKGRQKIALVGDTHATVMTDGQTTPIVLLVLMHGASVRLKARNNAVVRIEKSGVDCDVVIDKDDSSVILW